MRINPKKVEDLISRLEVIVNHIHQRESLFLEQIKAVDPYYRESAVNLVHYDAFRQKDLRGIQKKLRNLALSRLANSGSHLEASLLNTIFILKHLIGESPEPRRRDRLSIKKGKKLLRSRTKHLLGKSSAKRRVQIMVTQPSEAALNYDMVYDMVEAGMDCARINCAHDDEEIWMQIITNVKRASKELNKKVKIAMDLAGPKIRTGAMTPGPPIRKFSPVRDEAGRIEKPAEIRFVQELSEIDNQDEIVVDSPWWKQLKAGDELELIDTREKKRRLKVISVSEEAALVHTYETSYIGTGTEIIPIDSSIGSVMVGNLPLMEQAIILHEGDSIYITKDPTDGRPAEVDEDGNLLRYPHISCQIPELIDHVKPGETILFDDGKIAGEITECTSEYFVARITRAKENGSKLKAEKGMNFPDSKLNISGLSDKDREDLKFVARHADIVNFSFVNSVADVRELFQELHRLEAFDRVSIILKIETQAAYLNLKDILLEAMKSRFIGVMIARGDLAVEIGWNRIGRVQSEILALCESAHIPVVWATQVLENMAKKGLPSRSEITDATTSLRAECVMLNKGAYILDAIRLLNTILIDMERFHEKNEHMLPKLSKL